MLIDLKDKVTIVTGAGRGIGNEIARTFAAEGAIVVITDVRQDLLDQATADWQRNGWKGQRLKSDVSSGDECRAAAAAVEREFGRIDVLINNAGITRDAQLVKWRDGEVASLLTNAAFDAVIDVNLKGPFYCTRAVAPHMIRQQGGVILTASSIVGLYGNFGQTNYAAAKAAVISMTRTWARELGRYGIRVNAVAPGFIATDMVKAMPEHVREGMVGHTPLGRMGEPRDVAEAYAWLASPAARFVHGAVLSVDGGLVIGT
jgi:3-oxoacyl-[acyl-carrier protein] reductase